MSDFEKLVKKKPCPDMKSVKKAQRGERAEGVRDALKAGKGDVVKGAKRLGLKKDGLAAAERMAQKKKRNGSK